MGTIKFTTSYEDLSTGRGHQFKFYCDKCGNGYLTQFQPSTAEHQGGLLRAASGLLDVVRQTGSLGRGSGQPAATGRDKGRDEAVQRAILEGKLYFKQCGRCGKWVCREVCWNNSRDLCLECAPALEGDSLAC